MTINRIVRWWPLVGLCLMLLLGLAVGRGSTPVDDWFLHEGREALGPAPLQHTILSGTQKTGVTLQTLDDKSFDHGIILAQTPDPFLSVPNWEHCTYNELLETISPKAANLLNTNAMQHRLFY